MITPLGVPAVVVVGGWAQTEAHAGAGSARGGGVPPLGRDPAPPQWVKGPFMTDSLAGGIWRPGQSGARKTSRLIPCGTVRAPGGEARGMR